MHTVPCLRHFPRPFGCNRFREPRGGTAVVCEVACASGAQTFAHRSRFVVKHTATSVVTIERFIIEQERNFPDATGELSGILYDMALAGKLEAFVPLRKTAVMEGGKVPESCELELPDSATAPATALARLTFQRWPMPQLGTLVHVMAVFEAAETLQPVARYSVPEGP